MEWTRRTDWTFTDEEGTEWHEYPHAKNSSGLVSYGPSEEAVEDPPSSPLPRGHLTIGHQAEVFVDDDWPLDALLACLVRGRAWLEQSGMPEGTNMIGPKRTKEHDAAVVALQRKKGKK